MVKQKKQLNRKIWFNRKIIKQKNWLHGKTG